MILNNSPTFFLCAGDIEQQQKENPNDDNGEQGVPANVELQAPQGKREIQVGMHCVTTIYIC